MPIAAFPYITRRFLPITRPASRIRAMSLPWVEPRTTPPRAAASEPGPGLAPPRRTFIRRSPSALSSAPGRAGVILIAGIGGGYDLHSLLVPSPRPVVVYPLAVVLSGALAALQFGRARMARSLMLGLVGSLAAAWIAALILPLPGPRLPEPISQPMFWYRAIVLSVAASMVGLAIGFVYAIAAAIVRRFRGQAPPAELPLRFSLQKLFVAVTLLAVLFGATAFRLQQFKREPKLADRWSRAGVTLTFDYVGR